MLLKEIKNIFHKELDPLYPKEEVDSFFYLLLDHHLGLERFILVLNPDIVISKEEEQPLFEDLAQLKLEKPIQYIMGETHFMDRKFIVNEHVLIPRPETEELVRWILDDLKGTLSKKPDSVQKDLINNRSEDESFSILDIGTGSGCIAISLAAQLKAEVCATDISAEALEVAWRNAELHQVDIDLQKADVLQMDNMGKKFNLIVSNPPYVRESEKKEINNNVKKFEPGGALFVSDEDPLVFYRAIASFAKENLKPGGQLFLEINQYLGEETKQLLKNHSFSGIELRKDMFGNDRLLKGICSGPVKTKMI